MEKLWYIKIRGKQQGPYSIAQLRQLREITPETLVWYPKVSDWVPIRNVPELREVFRDFNEPDEPEEKPKENLASELVLSLPWKQFV